jgi:hypothetical protein
VYAEERFTAAIIAAGVDMSASSIRLKLFTLRPPTALLQEPSDYALRDIRINNR